jgi:sodium/hydrogen antiporter
MGVTEIFIIITVFILAYGLVSGRLKTTIITPPMIFITFGIILYSFNILHINLENEVVRILAELTLIMVLFNDASQINLQLLRKQYHIPFRLLITRVLCFGLFGVI